jgi:hypothetical protein
MSTATSSRWRCGSSRRALHTPDRSAFPANNAAHHLTKKKNAPSGGRTIRAMRLPARLRRPGTGPLLAVSAASALAAAFVAWAMFGAVYVSCSSNGGRETCADRPLVDEFGAGALAVSAPLLVSLLVWWLLHRSCSGAGRVPRRAAATVAGGLAVFSALAAASTGLLLMPIASLLVVAVATTEPATKR